MSGNLSRRQYRRRYVQSRRQPINSHESSADERIYIQLNRSRSDSLFSYYDNQIEDEDVFRTSKWSIVRQRLPDVLALSPTYKPPNVRAQLVLLVTLMNKQAHELRQLSVNNANYSPSLVQTNVNINIGGRNRLISLKRIPHDQMIYVDMDDLSFSIPTRQFIVAISRGDAHETAAKYCPPAISEMLIDLSKTKVADDGKQYRRALLKKHIGQMLFFSLFIFISGMILALFVSITKTVFKLNSFNHTSPIFSLASFSPSSKTDTEEYLDW